MIFRKRKEKIERHEVQTMNNPNALTIDKNNDGVPDFLQRPDIPSMVKTVSDTTLQHVDAQKELESIMMDWRGYEYDNNKSKWVASCPPMINELGVKQLGQLLKSSINKLTMNANISEEWCHIQTELISVTVVEWLADNKNIWQVKDSDLTPISEQIDSFTFLVLSRAINDRQRQHDTDRMKLTGNITNPPQSAI